MVSMRIHGLIISLVVATFLYSTPIRAAIIQYELEFQTTHIFVPGGGLPIPAGGGGLGSFSVDESQFFNIGPNSIAAVLNDSNSFRAAIEGNIYDIVLGTAGAVTIIEDQNGSRMIGFANSSSSSSLTMGKDATGLVWGTTVNNLRGFFDITTVSPQNGNIIDNGHFGANVCSSFATCSGWSSLGLGSVSTIERLTGSGNYVAELTTGSDSILGQLIDTPENPFNLSFEHAFTTSTGALEIYLGGELLDVINAAVSDSFTTHNILVDNSSFLNSSGQSLEFKLTGVTGSQVRLDSIVATVTDDVVTPPIPEPEIYAMMGIGMGVMGWVARRKKKQAAVL